MTVVIYHVVKSTLGSGNLQIIEDSGSVNPEALKDKCNEWLSKDYGAGLQPKILIEERLVDREHTVPPNHKFYVFHGNIQYVHVDFDRFCDRSMRFFDRDWNPQEFRKGGNPLGPAIDKPNRYEEMVRIAERLAEGLEFMRVDLYNLNDDRVVFGELTHCPANGRSPFNPRQMDFEFGSLW